MKEKEILLNQFEGLINAMDDSEVEIAKKHIIAYDSNNTGTSQKMFQIFSEIVYKENLSYEKLKEKVSPDVADTSFNRQIRRTLYRIQESLIVDVNLKRQGLYSTIFRKKFEIRKRIMQASILNGKGLLEMANRVYDNIIKSAKLFELYEELIEALILKQSIVLFLKGKKGFVDLNKQIEFYNKCRDLLQSSRIIYKTYAVELFSKGGKKEKVAFLKKNIEITEQYFKETHSANIKSQFLLLKMEYCYITDDFDGEEQAGLELLDLMSNNKAVYSKNRITFVCNSLANSMIANFRFSDSRSYVDRSIDSIVNKEDINYLNILKKKATSLFYLSKYKEAELVIEEIFGTKRLEKYPFHQSTSTYQKAMNEFAMGHFKESRYLLSNLREIEKDKEGWNVWTRIMRILCSIEMLKLNLIDYDVENFRKYIQRIDKQYKIRKRDKLVLKVLRDLDKCDYNFEEVAEKSATVLNQLKSTKEGIKWDPKSPEMILFHDWFMAKLEKRTYSPNFEPYKKALNQKAKELV